MCVNKILFNTNFKVMQAYLLFILNYNYLT